MVEMSSAKLEVRHILFKKISFHDFLKIIEHFMMAYSVTEHYSLVLRKKNQDIIFFFPKVCLTSNFAELY